MPISLPYGNNSFDSDDLKEHIRRKGWVYIIQGQTNRRRIDHPKPNSLDCWLRDNYAQNPDTKQAVNEVIEALVSTGDFAEGEFNCHDTGRRCKGIKILDCPPQRVQCTKPRQNTYSAITPEVENISERHARMSVCDFTVLRNLTLKDAKDSIRRYSHQNGRWLHQFDIFFGTTRATAQVNERMVKLLTVVRGSGWNMNRQGQCTNIIEDIEKKRISKEELEHFWKTVDALSIMKLRDLPDADCIPIEKSFDYIRSALRGWHSSSGSLCFMTKVILMFNWGQSPAFDTRIRSLLKLRNNMSNKELVTALVEIGTWIRNFESQNGIMLDKLATDEMRRVTMNSLSTLPLGRSFDMLLFSLS